MRTRVKFHKIMDIISHDVSVFTEKIRCFIEISRLIANFVLREIW